MDYMEIGKLALRAVIILVIGIILIKCIVGILNKILNRTKINPLVHSFVSTVTKIILIILLVLGVLLSLGFDLSGLIVGLGAVGAAIVFALKDSLVNVAGGLIIVVSKPFKKGDLIEINDKLGVAEQIDVMFTTLKTFDNQVITVPNGLLTTVPLVNHTIEDIRRITLTISISYDEDIDRVKKVIWDVIEKCEYILDDPKSQIYVSGHFDSYVGIGLKVWCNTENLFDTEYYLYEEVKKEFDKNEISIPYPQLDIHSK